MRLTWRDGAATIVAALVVLVLLAVTQSWSWPLLGGYRSDMLVVTVLGIAGCYLGLQFTDTSEFRRPMMVIGSVLGVVALGLVVFGLIFANLTFVVALCVTLLALWVVATVDHALPVRHGLRLPAGP